MEIKYLLFCNIIQLTIIICATIVLTLLSVSIIYACRHKQKRSKAAEMAKYWRGFYLNMPSSGYVQCTMNVLFISIHHIISVSFHLSLSQFGCDL